MTERDGTAGYFQDAFTLDLETNTVATEVATTFLAAAVPAAAVVTVVVLFLIKGKK